ncbi:MAG: cupin domain-containing protein [Phormidesmis sp.]
MNTQSTPKADLTVSADQADTGDMGQKLLISGDKVALRLWDEQPGDGEEKTAVSRDYETVGYVLEGKAELTLDGKSISLKPGTSWVVPQGAEHTYKITEPFRAVEATNPPARGYRSGQ